MMIEKHNNINAYVLAFVAAITAQVLLWMCLITAFLPSVYTQEVKGIFLRGRPFYPKEYDLLIYRVLIIVVIALTASLAIFIKKQWQQQGFLKAMARFSWVSGIWSAIGFWGFFISILFQGQVLAKWIQAAAILGNVLTAIFWPELNGFIQRFIFAGANIGQRLKRRSLALRMCIFISVAIVVFHLDRFLVLKENIPSLPFFFPLKYGMVAIYTLSFIVPCFYVVSLLWSLQRRRWTMGLSLVGLVIFLAYIRLPVAEYFWVLLLPIIPVGVVLVEEGFRLNKNIVSGLLLGIQAALVMAWIKELWPFAISPVDFSLMLYFVFIAVAVGSFMIMSVIGRVMPFSFISVQLILITLLSMSWFKLIIYDYRADLARFWFSILGALTVLEPLLWITGRWCWVRLERYKQLGNNFFFRYGIEGFILIGIALAVFVPDVEGLTAHIYMGEYFHHTDTYVMGPVWSYLKGAVVDVDMYSRYGIGTVPFYAWLMKIFGGISYYHLYQGIVVICTLYFMSLYIFFRIFINCRWLALTAWLMAFKTQIGFELAFPYVFTYPQSTVARQWPDIGWMITIFLYLQTKQRRWLVLASLIAGFSFWYMPSIGAYMIAAHAAMLGMLWYEKGCKLKQIWAYAWPVIAAIATAFALFVALCGTWFFSSVFWHNALDFMKMFYLTNTVYFTDLLRHRQFLNYIVFIIIVTVYLATIAYVVFDLMKTKKHKPLDLLAAGLSIYGLGLAEHYVTFSIGNMYYSKAVPFFGVLLYWFNQWISRYAPLQQRRIRIAACAAAFIALITNHSFVSYPNVINVSPNPYLDQRVARPLPDGRPYFYHKNRGTMPDNMMYSLNSLGQKDEGLVSEFDFKDRNAFVAYFKKDYDFSIDAKLIDELTNPNEEVPVISSFEVSILMKADRKPFFFFFPLVSTVPMKARSLPNDMMDTENDMHRILGDLERKKPAHIFIERMMVNQEIPIGYNESMPPLVELIKYVKEHYAFERDGLFLVAMKRK